MTEQEVRDYALESLKQGQELGDESYEQLTKTVIDMLLVYGQKQGIETALQNFKSINTADDRVISRA